MKVGSLAEIFAVHGGNHFSTFKIKQRHSTAVHTVNHIHHIIGATDVLNGDLIGHLIHCKEASDNRRNKLVCHNIVHYHGSALVHRVISIECPHIDLSVGALQFFAQIVAFFDLVVGFQILAISIIVGRSARLFLAEAKRNPLAVLCIFECGIDGFQIVADFVCDQKITVLVLLRFIFVDNGLHRRLGSGVIHIGCIFRHIIHAVPTVGKSFQFPGAGSV